MPRRGNGPQPKMRQGDSGISTTTPAQVTTAGIAMLPVPRITLASELKTQTRIGAGEDHVRIGQRRRERRAPLPPIARVEPTAAAEQRRA